MTPVLTLYWRALRRLERRVRAGYRDHLLVEATQLVNRLAILATGPIKGTPVAAQASDHHE